MKLLFDENLSPRLAEEVSVKFSESVHVRDVGLSAATDAGVWNYAADNGFAIVSKDGDFSQVSILRGAPPKVIWIRRGNCTTAEIATLLQSNVTEILQFETDSEAALLELF